jgi:hypothetical protein
MKAIIKAELKYNRELFALAIGISAIVGGLNGLPFREDLINRVMIFWVLFVFLINWNQMRNREKRDMRDGILPLSLARMGCVRVIVPALIALAAALAYAAVEVLVKPGPAPKALQILTPAAVIMLMFSLYFMGRDLLLYHLRNNRVYPITPERARTILVFLILFLNLLGIVLFIQASQRSAGMSKILDSIIKGHPFRGEAGLIRLYLTAAGLSLLSILTYRSRRSFTD